MVDDPAQLDVVEAIRLGEAPVRVAIDIDAGLRLGGRTSGPSARRCTTTSRSSAFARQVAERPGSRWSG